eukprot:g4140.t1
MVQRLVFLFFCLFTFIHSSLSESDLQKKLEASEARIKQLEEKLSVLENDTCTNNTNVPEGRRAFMHEALKRLKEAPLSTKKTVFDLVAPHVFASYEYFDIENAGSIFAMLLLEEKRTNREPVKKAFLERPDCLQQSIPPNRNSGHGGRAGRSVSKVATHFLTFPISEKEKENGLSSQSVQKVSERLDRWGVTVLPSLVSASALRSAREWITEELLHPTGAFSSIYSSKEGHRYDYPLPISGPAENIFNSVLKTISPMLSQVLGEDAVLVEFSVMASFSKSPFQLPHSDTGYSTLADARHRALLYSCFVYLDDVDHEQAALDVWPGTNKLMHVDDHVKSDIHWSQLPSVRIAVRGGSVAIMDSRTLHRGSGHTSTRTKKPRYALYFTWLSRRGSEPLGSTWTMRPRYEDSVLLKDAVNRIYNEKGKKGRFCFGGINGTKIQDMENYYPAFGLCTAFNYPPNRLYVIDALYNTNHVDGYLAIWVNGKRTVIDPRYFFYEPGPITVGKKCHDRKKANGGMKIENRSFHGLVHGVLVVEATGSLPNMGNSIDNQWPPHLYSHFPKKNNDGVRVLVETVAPETNFDLWSRSGEDIVNVAKESEEMNRNSIESGTIFDKDEAKLSKYAKNQHIWVRLVVTPSEDDDAKTHGILTLGGDYSLINREGSWDVRCIGMPLMAIWGAGRQSVKDYAKKLATQRDIVEKLEADVANLKELQRDRERTRRKAGKYN